MRLLRLIFLQDLPFHHRDHPNLPIFKSKLLIDHWEAFERWKKLAIQYNTECSEMAKNARLLHVLEGEGEVGPTVFKGIPIFPKHADAPAGFKKVPIVGSELLFTLEKVRA